MRAGQRVGLNLGDVGAVRVAARVWVGDLRVGPHRQRGLRHRQRGEDALLEGLLQRLAGELLDDQTEQDDVGIAVLERRAGLGVHRVGERDGQQLVGRPGLAGIGVEGLVEPQLNPRSNV